MVPPWTLRTQLDVSLCVKKLIKKSNLMSKWDIRKTSKSNQKSRTTSRRCTTKQALMKNTGAVSRVQLKILEDRFLKYENPFTPTYPPTTTTTATKSRSTTTKTRIYTLTLTEHKLNFMVPNIPGYCQNWHLLASV